MRSTTDTALLGRYWGISEVADDDNLFAAAIEIARDNAASTPARVYALLTIVRMTRVNPSPTYANLVGGWTQEAGLRAVRGGCATRYVDHPARDVGAPLRSEWRRVALALRTELSSDKLAPVDVQTAAWCIADRRVGP
jgi:hypothetical protein